MVEVIEEVRGVFTVPTLTGQVLPIGLGAVASDRIGDRISGILPADVKATLGKTLDATSEAAAGVGIVGLAGLMPPDIKPGVRLAGVAGIGLGVFHLVGELIGSQSSPQQSSPQQSSPVRIVKQGKSTPTKKASFSRY